MIYSPIFDLFLKLEKHFYIFLVYLSFYLLAYLLDAFLIYNLNIDFPAASLFLFGGGYVAARYVIRKAKKQELFGSFATNSVIYCLFLAIFAWFAYLIFLRIKLSF